MLELPYELIVDTTTIQIEANSKEALESGAPEAVHAECRPAHD
ncbi:MAG: hypothetical protein VKJ87_07015 [Synechococcus sp.]|nr:hypothetical protein [Synechococcus sp.]